MEEWLFELGKKYLNAERVSFTCKLLIGLQIVVVFVNLGFLGAAEPMSKMSDGLYNAVGVFLQPLQDICMTILFWGLVVVLHGKKMYIPVALYVFIVIFANSLLTFLSNFTGSSHGLFLGLLSLSYYILTCLLGIKLRNTSLAKLSMPLIIYSVFDIVNGVFIKGQINVMLLVEVGLIVYLAMTFNDVLPKEFQNESSNNNNPKTL